MTDAEAVKALRDQYGIGISEAARIIRGERLRAQLYQAHSKTAIKAVLDEIIHDLYPKRPR